MADRFGRLLFIFLLFGAGLLILLIVLASPSPTHPFFMEGPPRPWVIAHQGGDGLWPGDTLFAYENAAKLGVDVLEMDLHQTQDGVLVLMHDSTVDRTTNGSGEIRTMAYSAIQDLDAGYDWSSDGGATYPFRGAGITVPTLEDIFQAFPDAWMNIEIKQVEPSIGEAFCALIRQHQMQNQVLVASFHTQAMDDFRHACPEVATSGTRSELTLLYALTTLFLGRTLSPDYQAVQAPEFSSGLRVLSPRFIDSAHQSGLEVHPWTINETQEMQRFLEMGADGIITDRPDRMLELLDR